MADVMTPELRAMALRLLGEGAARQAGETVNDPARQAEIQAQEMAANQGQQPVPAMTGYGGPAGQPAMGGPAQGAPAPAGAASAPMPGGMNPAGMVTLPNGRKVTPQQAAMLARILRSRQ